MLRNSHTFVICSRDRTATLFKCLDSINLVELSHLSKILIVINGTDLSNYSKLCEEISKRYPVNFKLLYSSPGLPQARNLALANLETELVTFLDDDVILPTNFLCDLDKFFELNPQVDGGSPKISGLYSSTSSSKVRSYFSAAEKNYGKVTRYCRNYWVPDNSDCKTLKVMWLPGCCMTYRRSAIHNVYFNPQLTLGPSQGYALGEDVEFSLRIKNLVAIKSITIAHNQASSIRDSGVIMAKARGRWHGYLINNFPSVTSKNATFCFEFSNLLYLLLRLIVLRKSAANDLILKIHEIYCLLWEISKPSLIDVSILNRKEKD